MDKLTDQQKAALLQQAQMAQSEAMQKAIASMSEHCFKVSGFFSHLRPSSPLLPASCC